MGVKKLMPETSDIIMHIALTRASVLVGKSGVVTPNESCIGLEETFRAK